MVWRPLRVLDMRVTPEHSRNHCHLVLAKILSHSIDMMERECVYSGTSEQWTDQQFCAL